MARVGEPDSRGDYRCATCTAHLGAFLFFISMMFFATAFDQERSTRHYLASAGCAYVTV